MDICLIMDNPETPRHPVIGVALQQLRTRSDSQGRPYTVRLLDVRTLTPQEAIAQEESHSPADLYLLKSHAPQALDLAHFLEQRGAVVVNSWESSIACQDRVLMAERMHAVQLPWPRTWHFPSLANLLADSDTIAALPFPLIIKSHYSHRGDLVDKVHSVEDIQALAPQWSAEPIVLQEFVAGDGWDIKLWVIDSQIFAARRRTPLEPNASKEDFPIPPQELPTDWANITLEIGRVFNLRLYGVDLLITERGPIIVDVNSFPGFRGVPGADSALVALVERLLKERKPSVGTRFIASRFIASPSPATELSIQELPSIVTLLFERAQRPLLPDAQGPLGLFVRYLRRKPQRGLAVIYSVDEIQRKAKSSANDPNRSVSLTLDESALEGSHIRFDETQAQQALVEVQPSGVLRANDLGLSVQAFPADAHLPALAPSCDTSRHSPVFSALQSAARIQLADPSWRLIFASAEPVRYKPANRCVIRYTLTLEHPSGNTRNLTIFGKVYADPQQAHDVQILMQQLYDEQASTSPFLPRPLGLLEELGLTLNEAIQPSNPQESLLTGTRALRPQIIKGRGGEIIDTLIPTAELQLTAQALARLHTSRVHPHESTPRTGAKEAKRVRERASLIESYIVGATLSHKSVNFTKNGPLVRRGEGGWEQGGGPLWSPVGGADSSSAPQFTPMELASTLPTLAQQLAARLESLQPDAYRPAHGGFKASQLLFHDHQVFVVDFDGFCLADPALDVGYFLAYLRPSALWYSRPGMRQWFEASAKIFTNTYQQAMLERGLTQAVVDGILERSRLYEAALLFKIATRRVNRLNSPRPQELAAMLNEIAACLSNGRE